MISASMGTTPTLLLPTFAAPWESWLSGGGPGCLRHPQEGSFQVLMLNHTFTPWSFSILASQEPSIPGTSS